MKSIIDRALLLAIAGALTACATTDNVLATTAPAGTGFSEKGKVTLHRGEPCTSQIMFDFRPSHSKTVVWLAAGAHESRKLTDAAREGRGVGITGVWRRGQHPGCAYVDVKKLTVQGSWWSNLFKP